MKCFSITAPGKVRKYILSSDIREMLPPVLRKRKHIATAFLDFEFFPDFTYSQFRTEGYREMYGYGTTRLAAKKTAHEQYVPKTAMLVLFDHKKFYLDKAEGDRSRSVWINHRLELVMTIIPYFRLREIGTRHSWALNTKHKLVKHIL